MNVAGENREELTEVDHGDQVEDCVGECRFVSCVFYGAGAITKLSFKADR